MASLSPTALLKQTLWQGRALHSSNQRQLFRIKRYVLQRIYKMGQKSKEIAIHKQILGMKCG
jgi:hypothetical protein